MKKTRRIIQAVFLALVLGSVFLVGGHCERWCPFGGIEAIGTYVSEGNMLCSLGTSNFFILGGVLMMTLLLRRVFCSHMCPLGAISEWIHELGRYLSLPNLRIPNRIDRGLAFFKYGVLAIILIATWRASELVFRGFGPCYALISRHGTDITIWAYIVLGTIIVASLFLIVPFCRWFCPLAAVLNPLSRIGLTRIRRNPENCSQCGFCSDQCPAAIPVDQLQQVRAARCISCLNCIDCCPKKDPAASALEWWPAHRFGKRWSHPILIGVMLLCTTFAVAASYTFPIPSFVKSHGVASSDLSRIDLKINNLTCRGRGNLLFYFLERDDLYEIPGFFRVDAWPGPGWADVVITFEKSATHPSAIKQAITEPYYDAVGGFWRNSPFRIQGYDPLMIYGEMESDIP